MATLSRSFNRASNNMPVVVVIREGKSISLIAIERTKYIRKGLDGEKTGKATLLFQINCAKPHRGHLLILQDLANHKAQNFDELYDHWRKVLNIQELNKRFYRELSTWYFWALKQVTFPRYIQNGKRVEQDIANSQATIRLITRIIFVWFMKEKGLVSEDIFEKGSLDTLLKWDDPKNSTYYRAILQNLFFATLNTEDRSNRMFDTDAPKYQGKSNAYMQHNYYRYDQYFKDKKRALSMFAEIPFLNGGLFECLDTRIEETGEEIRIDCFSNHASNIPKLSVPDGLFFGEERIIDLSDVYDDPKKSKEKVRGLFHILNSYKFTIAENTPLEEEVALDPELLGRIFENLLASYNEETRTTARKSTGSFYTPREIVGYMVEESLKAYLEQAVPASADRLNILFDESITGNPYTPEESSLLIDALDRCTILDPACGSGAFPMGILHTMVALLRKLDPENRVWLEKVLQRVPSEIRADTELALRNNELDYTRKLGLIQNCIYGVDIQPIAVQIAKLRFFISLLVDQKVSEHEPNRGVRALPNLETKFVAANSLIGIVRPPQMGIFRETIEPKEQELKKVREEHFRADTRAKKLRVRRRDEELRTELQKLYKDAGASADTATQLAAWNPYDQNQSAPFFDPEWMFEITEGFDIVIGNPPYGGKISLSEKRYFEETYKSAKTISGIQKGSLDTFTIFIDFGCNLCRKGGNLHYIVPISITSSDSMTGIHNVIENNCSLIKVSSYAVRPQPIFENAVVNTSILFLKCNNIRNQSILSTKMYRKSSNFDIQLLINNLKFIEVKDLKLRGRYPKIGSEIERRILGKILKCESKVRGLLNNKGKNIYYRTTGGRYFKIITNYSTGSTKEKALQFEEKFADVIGAILSSSLYFWFYQIYSNNLDLKSYEIEEFGIPLNKIENSVIKTLESVYALYLADIEKNVNVRQTTKYANIESFKEYKIGRSKNIIDKLDDAICPLYDLTDEETEYIKNYEIEFRLNDEN